MKRAPRVLFIVKKRTGYWGDYSTSAGTGLWNSARFVVDMLTNVLGIEAKIVQVVDNNDIDREVTLYRPTHVIIEAFWVVPEKFDVLRPLHPGVTWIVRDHSETPFLANEGSAFGWTREYLKRGLELMCNSPRAQYDMRRIAIDVGADPELVSFGPNFYPIAGMPEAIERPWPDDEIHVSCFGAIRPLKNQVTQAIAALAFAQRIGRELRFHVNAGRVEGGADPIPKSLRNAVGPGRLIEHPWMTHDEFVRLAGTMDISLQVSFSETFNIVTADAVAGGVPVIVSPEVYWLGEYAHASPTSAEDIADAMFRAWVTDPERRARKQLIDLAQSNEATVRTWRRRFKPHHDAAAIDAAVARWFRDNIPGSPISWSDDTWFFLQGMIPRLLDALERID